MAAGVGRVRSLAFLSLLQWCALAFHTYAFEDRGCEKFPPQPGKFPPNEGTDPVPPLPPVREEDKDSHHHLYLLSGQEAGTG